MNNFWPASWYIQSPRDLFFFFFFQGKEMSFHILVLEMLSLIMPTGLPTCIWTQMNVMDWTGQCKLHNFDQKCNLTPEKLFKWIFAPGKICLWKSSLNKLTLFSRIFQITSKRWDFQASVVEKLLWEETKLLRQNCGWINYSRNSGGKWCRNNVPFFQRASKQDIFRKFVIAHWSLSGPLIPFLMENS